MRTGIIGAGKVGCSLGKYFRLNNLKVTGYYDVNENLAKEAATDRKSTRLNSSHWKQSRMPSSA